MRCKEIMSDSVQWVTEECSVSQAARMMAMHGVELLAVCGADAHPLGVITDRDIVVRVVAKHRDAELTRVDAVMTSPAQSVPPDCPVERAAEIMSKEGLSQLLVLGAEGRTEGVVGLNDLLAHTQKVDALDAIRGVLAWRSADLGPVGAVTGRAPDGEGNGAEASTSAMENTNPARVEAEMVVQGGVNSLREFPG
jgi:CBS domain-containing protein